MTSVEGTRVLRVGIIIDERRKADYTVDQLRKLSGRLIFMNKNYSPDLSLVAKGIQ